MSPGKLTGYHKYRYLVLLRSDHTTKEKMPRDGTVFQLTSNVILFLEQLLDFVETVASILQQDSSYNQVSTLLASKNVVKFPRSKPQLVLSRNL